MKKVLIVFNHPAPYKVRLFNELAKHFELFVIFERDSNKNRDNLFYNETKRRFNTATINGLKIGNENFISTGIKNHLKKNTYDLVIMNGYSTFAEMSALRYLKRKKIPYIFYINGGIIKKDETHIKKAIKTYFIKGAKAYLSPDDESNKYLIYYGADKNKIFNYNYSTIYKSEIAKIVNKKKINNKKVFVSSGQLIKRKNYLTLIEEFHKINRNYELHIFGDGPERARINKYIKDNKISNVFLRGFKTREEIFNFYSSADAFLFSSNEDIYGHVVNEALSQGLPVISTKNVNSSKKLLKNGYNGYILNDLTKAELEKAITCIFKKDLSKNCIKTASENTIEKMAEQHINIFSEVME